MPFYVEPHITREGEIKKRLKWYETNTIEIDRMINRSMSYLLPGF